VASARHAFFEHPILDGQRSHQLLELFVLLTQLDHIVTRGLSLCVAHQASLARFWKLFTPSPESRIRLFRQMLRTVFAAVVFLVFLAIVSSSKTIVTDGENLSYFWLPICPIVSDATQWYNSFGMLMFT
jgi:hypothetical protein